jgi:hypothetical protein
VEYFNSVGSMISDAIYTHKIKFRMTIATAAFNKKKTSLPPNWT